MQMIMKKFCSITFYVMEEVISLHLQTDLKS